MNFAQLMVQTHRKYGTMIEEWGASDEKPCDNCGDLKHTTLEMIGPSTIRSCLDCQKIPPSQRGSVEWVDIDSIVIPKNSVYPRASIVKAMAKTIDVGCYPILTLRRNSDHIIDGTIRFLALKSMGVTKVKVKRVDN